MDDLKKIKQQFIKTYITYILVIATGIVLTILLSLWIEDGDVFVGIVLLGIIVLIFISSYYQLKLERITNVSFLMRIRQAQSQPLPLYFLENSRDFEKNLKKLGFKIFKTHSDFTLFYRINADIAKRLTKRYMNEIVILVNENKQEFYQEKADEQVTLLNQAMLKEKKKINRMLITQVKIVDELDESTKSKIKDIVFYRAKREVISTINVGVHYKSNQAVMLYSNSYSPSIYYTYHVNLIKEII